MKCSQCGGNFDYWTELTQFTFKIQNDKNQVIKNKGTFCDPCFTRLLKLENKYLNFKRQ
jgi:hypothetical protein